MLIPPDHRPGRHLTDFARTRDVLAEGGVMTRRALSAVTGFFTLCLAFSAFAQPDAFVALNHSALRLPSLALSDGGSFSFATGFSWVETTSPDFLPALRTPDRTGPRTATGNAASAGMPVRDSSKEGVELRRPSFFDHASGEVGFLYGRSSGKYGVTTEQGYIIGEVGDDKFHITVGASHEESSGRLPRFVR